MEKREESVLFNDAVIW